MTVSLLPIKVADRTEVYPLALKGDHRLDGRLIKTRTFRKSWFFGTGKRHRATREGRSPFQRTRQLRQSEGGAYREENERQKGGSCEQAT